MNVLFLEQPSQFILTILPHNNIPLPITTQKEPLTLNYLSMPLSEEKMQELLSLCLMVIPSHLPSFFFSIIYASKYNDINKILNENDDGLNTKSNDYSPKNPQLNYTNGLYTESLVHQDLQDALPPIFQMEHHHLPPLLHDLFLFCHHYKDCTPHIFPFEHHQPLLKLVDANGDRTFYMRNFQTIQWKVLVKTQLW